MHNKVLFIITILLFSFLYSGLSLSSTDSYDGGYKLGYTNGEMDKKNGHPSDPYGTASAYEWVAKSNNYDLRAFREGFIKGYRDGYSIKVQSYSSTSSNQGRKLPQSKIVNIIGVITIIIITFLLYYPSRFGRVLPPLFILWGLGGIMMWFVHWLSIAEKSLFGTLVLIIIFIAGSSELKSFFKETNILWTRVTGKSKISQ